MPGVKKYYRDFWNTTWQDINRCKDRYRTELYLALVGMYTRDGLETGEAAVKARAELEQLDKELAKEAATDAEYWECGSYK